MLCGDSNPLFSFPLLLSLSLPHHTLSLPLPLSSYYPPLFLFSLILIPSSLFRFFPFLFLFFCSSLIPPFFPQSLIGPILLLLLQKNRWLFCQDFVGFFSFFFFSSKKYSFSCSFALVIFCLFLVPLVELFCTWLDCFRQYPSSDHLCCVLSIASSPCRSSDFSRRPSFSLRFLLVVSITWEWFVLKQVPTPLSPCNTSLLSNGLEEKENQKSKEREKEKNREKKKQKQIFYWLQRQFAFFPTVLHFHFIFIFNSAHTNIFLFNCSRSHTWLWILHISACSSVEIRHP